MNAIEYLLAVRARVGTEVIGPTRFSIGQRDYGCWLNSEVIVGDRYWSMIWGEPGNLRAAIREVKSAGLNQDFRADFCSLPLDTQRRILDNTIYLLQQEQL